MTSVYVISGSDTEVGKTFVTTGLIRALKAQGRPVRAIKPIESGIDAHRHNDEDGVRLARASGQTVPMQALVRLEAPIAPPAAADLQNFELSWSEILEKTQDALDASSVNVVEGAGGLLSPLTWDKTALDLASAIFAKLLLVVPDRLGAVHQTRSCLAAARSKGLRVTAVVLSTVDQRDHTSGQNRASLLKCPEWAEGQGPLILSLPHLDSGESHEVFDELAGVIAR